MSIYTIENILTGLKNNNKIINEIEGNNDKEKVKNYILNNKNMALILDDALEYISNKTNIPQTYIFDRLIDRKLWE